MTRKSGKRPAEMQPIVEGKKLSGAQRRAQGWLRTIVPGVKHTGGRGKVR